MSNILQKIFGTFDFNETQQQLQARLATFELPMNAPTEILDYIMERSYLDDVSSRDNQNFIQFTNGNNLPISWIKIERLPIHPSTAKEYDLMSKWQSVLSSLHAWGHKTIFMLQRKNGNTNLYIGVESLNEGIGTAHLKSALINSMPGVDITTYDSKSAYESITSEVHKYAVGGAVTGIPSWRNSNDSRFLQTLDQLAFGIRNDHDEDVNFSMMVIAEPLKDEQIVDIMHRYQKIGSEIHSEVNTHISDNTGYTQGMTSTTSSNISLGIGQMLSCAVKLGAFVTSNPTLFATLLGTGISFGYQRGNQQSVQVGRSISKDYLNKFAQYTEHVTDLHCNRLRKGRNLGFWNVGVHVLSNSDSDINTIMGMLRSIYSGEQTYMEPIRLHSLNQPKATDYLKNFQLVPLAMPKATTEENWHLLGSVYQYLATPMNTEEFALATSLPRKDVPGLRFVRSSVRFANNPGNTNEQDSIPFGHIIDSGIEQKNEYKIDINALVKHSLVVGSTGCGKTTTCKTIINNVLTHGVPVLIIEPAKDEYVRWAIEQNKRLPKDKKINIFMPGIKNLDAFGIKDNSNNLSQLRLNPFQPAAIGKAPIDMLTHCEQLTALINNSLPTSDILPILIDEAFYTYLLNQCGPDFAMGDIEQRSDYPKLEGVLPIAKRILQGRGYAPTVANGLAAALETRFNYLTRGKRGDILNNVHSTSFDTLFNQTTVINLSKIGNAKDTALIMSLLMLALYEYRISAYLYDTEYRQKAQSNKLLHLTVVEEAHNVLSRPRADTSGIGNPQQVVADLFSNMLSEIRSYGEGLMIVDQIPTRLIPDAMRNTNLKIAHRLVSRDDCDVMATALGLRMDQTDIIPLLSQGHALISSDRDDAASWVKINKPNILL